jgi:hypothetical protein
LNLDEGGSDNVEKQIDQRPMNLTIQQKTIRRFLFFFEHHCAMLGSLLQNWRPVPRNHYAGVNSSMFFLARA